MAQQQLCAITTLIGTVKNRTNLQRLHSSTSTVAFYTEHRTTAQAMLEVTSTGARITTRASRSRRARTPVTSGHRSPTTLTRTYEKLAAAAPDDFPFVIKLLSLSRTYAHADVVIGTRGALNRHPPPPPPPAASFHQQTAIGSAVKTIVSLWRAACCCPL